MKIPAKLKSILCTDEQLAANIVTLVKPFSDILERNDLFFFSEYTNHGINHIEDTLQYIENLIAEENLQENDDSRLTPEEIGIIIISVILHDIGMHTNGEMFKNMLAGEYDDLVEIEFGEKTWKELWEEYLYDSKYWGYEKKENIFGNGKHKIEIPNFTDLQKLNEYDKKFIGEFIRLHHCRIAYEVAIKGYIGIDVVLFNEEKNISEEMIKIAGVVARSHGMDVRDTFNYLEAQLGDYRNPFGIHVVYIMVLLRLADYLQIDNSRTNVTSLSMRMLYSPHSRQEHRTHLAIKNIQFKCVDKEKIRVDAYPQDAQLYVKIDRLIKDIQKEFDLSWAILGEVYSGNDYKLRYRRITCNIKTEKYISSLNYVPQHFCFKFNNELSKLLVAPLYGDNPSFGVRELVQNAADACRECMTEIISACGEEPHVIVTLDSKESLFTVTDTGKGMTLDEIEHYFLTIGSSFSGDVSWQKKRDENHIFRTGRFGIGVLASYLLGSKIVVETRSRRSRIGYKFEASLQDKFIEIKKAANITYGTKIKIKCNERSIRKLVGEVFAREHLAIEDRYYTPKWYEWYIDEKPEVKYYIDGELLSQQTLKGYNLLNHRSNQFGPIFWKPVPFNINYSKNLLCCNGILVAKQSNKVNFAQENIDELYPLRIPSLHITDMFNILPLDLQRHNIEADTVYAFEYELASEMYVDLLCQLMAFKVNLFKLKSIDLAKFYFLHSGFIPTTHFTKNYCIGHQRIDICLSHSGNFDFNEYIKLFYQFPDLIFHFDFEEIDKTRSNIIGNQHNKKLIERICSALDELHDKCNTHFSGYRIVNMNQQNTTSKFNSLFEKYLGEDPIIPYDMARREEKFPLLHNEFKDKINEYKLYFEKKFDNDGSYSEMS